MTYPFAPHITFAELRQRLSEEFGCELKHEYVIIGPSNDRYPITYFEREMPSETLTCSVVFPDDDSECVDWSFLRSILTRLRIDLREFDLDLDEFE